MDFTIIYLLAGLLNGYTLASILLGRSSWVLSLANMFPCGMILIILINHILPYHKNPITSCIISVILSAFLYFLKHRICISDNKMPQLSKMDLFVYIINFSIWGIYLTSFIGYDEINHFYHAAQIQKGTYPPTTFLAKTVELKYHFGWDVLLAIIKTICKMEFPYITYTLMLCFIASNSLMLLLLLKTHFSSHIYITFFAFFMGSGILGIIKTILGEGGNGVFLSLWGMYNQHAWTFTISILLLVLAILSFTPFLRRKYYTTMLYCIFVLSISATLYSATSIVVIGLFLMFWGCYTFIKEKDKFAFFMAIFIGVSLLTIWKFMNIGILASGIDFDSPKFKLSINVFGLKNYIKYEGAYLLMTTYTALIYIWIIHKWIRLKSAFFKETPFLLFLFFCILLLYPMPFLIVMENSAYWDNFCKFNFISILASFILLPTFLNKTKNNIYKIIIIFIIFNMFLGYLFKNLPIKDYFKEHNSYIEKNKTLPNLAKSMQAINPYDKIVIITNRIKAHYLVSKETNKSDINLYKYINSNYSHFLPIIQEHGISAINFYDYNFLYNRKDEYLQIDILDSLYRGKYDNLNLMDIRYILSCKSEIPFYIEKMKLENIIELYKEDNKENWILYKIK